MMAQEDGETERRQEEGGGGDVEDDDDESMVELEMPHLEPVVLPAPAIERNRLGCADNYNSSSLRSHVDFSVVGRGDGNRAFGEMIFPEPMDTTDEIGPGYIRSLDGSSQEESGLAVDITNEYLAYCYNMLHFRTRHRTV